MTSKKRPREGSFRVLRGLNFERNGDQVRVEAGEIVAGEDLPRHGTGQCETSCNRPGGHDHLLIGSDPVLARVDMPAEE